MPLLEICVGDFWNSFKRIFNVVLSLFLCFESRKAQKDDDERLSAISTASNITTPPPFSPAIRKIRQNIPNNQNSPSVPRVSHFRSKLSMAFIFLLPPLNHYISLISPRVLLPCNHSVDPDYFHHPTTFGLPITNYPLPLFTNHLGLQLIQTLIAPYITATPQFYYHHLTLLPPPPAHAILHFSRFLDDCKRVCPSAGLSCHVCLNGRISRF